MYSTSLSIKIQNAAVTLESFFRPLPRQSSPQPRANHCSGFVQHRLDLSFLEFYISRIMQYVFFCARKASCTQHVSEIHCVYQYCIHFYCLVVVHCVSISQLVYPFSLQWASGLFQFGAVIGKAAMNILYKYSYLQVDMQKRNCWMFVQFYKKLQTLLHSLPKKCMRVLVMPYLHEHLVVFFKLYLLG